MIGKIENVEQAFSSKGDEYLKVTVTNESNGQTTVKNIWNQLEQKWPILVIGSRADFKMEKKGQFWNVIDVLPVDMPPPQQPQPAPNEQAVMKDVKTTVINPAPERVSDRERQHSIETQVAAKLITELWIAGKLEQNETPPTESCVAVINWCYGYLQPFI